MSEEIRAVVAGHLCLDIIPGLGGLAVSPAEMFRPGGLTEIGPAAISTGGAVPNTGLALLKLGIPTSLMGKIGDDPFGSLVRQLLESRGGAGGLIEIPGEATSYTIVLSPEGYDRMFLHYPASNTTFCADDIRYDVVARSRLFHLGYPTLLHHLYSNEGRELVEIFHRVKDLGVTTSLDVTLPDPDSPGGHADWRWILEKVMPYVDIFLPSAGEILFMLNRPLYDKYKNTAPDDFLPLITGEDTGSIGKMLLEMGVAIAGVKCGSRGFYLRTAGQERLTKTGKAAPADTAAWADREFWTPAYHAEKYTGATGAGDSAIAGFLAAFLRGHSPGECVSYAAAAGAFCVTAPDAFSGLGSWEQLTAAIKADWPQELLQVVGEGWTGDGVWRGPCDSGD